MIHSITLCLPYVFVLSLRCHSLHLIPGLWDASLDACIHLSTPLILWNFKISGISTLSPPPPIPSPRPLQTFPAGCLEPPRIFPAPHARCARAGGGPGLGLRVHGGADHRWLHEGAGPTRPRGAGCCEALALDDGGVGRRAAAYETTVVLSTFYTRPRYHLACLPRSTPTFATGLIRGGATGRDGGGGGCGQDIFHDARAVHAAAAYSVEHMNKDVDAADHAVSEIEADAEEAAQVLGHIHDADTAAVAFAKHARESAVTAADAADGALQGQRAAVAGGVRAVAAAHAAQAASQASAEYAAAARAAAAARPPRFYYGPAAGSDEGDAAAALVDAKGLVEAVVVLMQQLTNALEAAGSDCNKVDQILTYYQVSLFSLTLARSRSLCSCCSLFLLSLSLFFSLSPSQPHCLAHSNRLCSPSSSAVCLPRSPSPPPLAHSFRS